ncbi:hypothetical protein [Brasilonema sp. UFV-L1]|uniref:hypothetical protein n=1 Tax=Brasilonema sp. UFV-L1 TaxID=2234130 RepID=UPI00145D8372|nr:hypothetical protein [Brasilonema sp. UFV-L1]NMG09757.1 hypothetical protein [Brasilonema sp. UFV-L1]
MIRKLLFGACIGGLIMGQVYEAPHEQQTKEQRLWQNTQSSNDKTRARAEGELLRLARNFDVSNRARAEAIYQQILASNPNNEQAHVRLAEIYLERWNGKNNSADKELGLQHLRRAIELAHQRSKSLSEETPLLKEATLDYIKKLSTIEEKVNQGVTGYGLNFPQY